MIPCIHKGNKTIMKILFLGKPKEVAACADCENMIKESQQACKILNNGGSQ